MFNRLYAFLIKYELLYSLQFGFRKYHATYMALVCMLDKLHALEKGDYAIGIFIDFRKAFDTEDHSILLYKLYHYGVRGPAYDCFWSFSEWACFVWCTTGIHIRAPAFSDIYI